MPSTPRCPRQGGVRLEQTAFQTALIRGDPKLVHDLTASRFQLFDRSSDPEEHENLIDTHPRAEELRRELLEWEGSRAAMQSAVLNPTGTEIEQLRALGYVHQ